MPTQPGSRDVWTRWPLEWRGHHPTNTDRVAPWEITPAELRLKMDLGDPLLLVDVREPWEVRVASLHGAVHVPFNELRFRSEDELYPDDEIVLYCQYGDRSLEAAVLLWEMGYEHVQCLAGGIDRWSIQVDPDVPRY